MKGIVFTEFLDMVEEKFGYETVDKILNESNLPSGGVYTSVGTYDHGEIVSLISNLSDSTGIDIPSLLRAFGHYMFQTFLKGYPVFFAEKNHAFEFLESIDNHIHVEVRKLYPDAVLPSFDSNVEGDTMKMIYRSPRKMSDFALGLIEKSLEHYGHKYSIDMSDLDDNGEVVEFSISLMK